MEFVANELNNESEIFIAFLFRFCLVSHSLFGSKCSVIFIPLSDLLATCNGVTMNGCSLDKKCTTLKYFSKAGPLYSSDYDTTDKHNYVAHSSNVIMIAEY